MQSDAQNFQVVLILIIIVLIIYVSVKYKSIKDVERNKEKNNRVLQRKKRNQTGHESYVPITQEITPDRLKKLYDKSRSYEGGNKINYLHNILVSNLSQTYSDRPIVGQIVPIYNKYLKWSTNEKYEQDGVVYYVLGTDKTISCGEDLKQLYFTQFGSKEVQVPDVINVGIIGGYPIYQLNNGQSWSYKDFKKYFINVLGTQNNTKTGLMDQVKPMDQNIENLGDNKKKITSDYIHKYEFDQTQAVGEQLLKRLNSSGRQLKSLNVVSGLKKKTKEITSGNQDTIDVTQPGTEDIILCLIIDYK